MAENDQTTMDRRKEARVAIMELANMVSVPMSLHAIVTLNIPEAIWQSGANTPLSPSQILSKLGPTTPPTAPSPDPQNLQRILRMLASYDVFIEHLDSNSADERRYSLSEIGKTLVPDKDGLSYAPYVLQHHQDALMRAWPRLHEAVLDPTVEPFVKANGGVSAYQYYGEKPEMNELMQRAMEGVSGPYMKAMLDGYGDGFKQVDRLVDVGGSSGACLKMIMDRNPHVKEGINFDLPEVVAKAPSIPGVTHVGGDMFKSIPSGDAIFMKWVLTTWTDDECMILLKNCYNALPQGGKLIACEPVLPKGTDSSRRTRALLEGDIFVMAIYRAKGRERTEEEFQQLGYSVGFRTFRAIYLDHFYTLLEFQR
ncbi:nicotinate N-methyltransferase 1 [Magnolia sinica]|uniref:nicotinate N-methyltransferase 1 n=1 Tax=Magnolia sinica TaxID=86752 RepID=UPI002659DF03|nr:nicotinate N-methyltransferase 1 [Magnolia sinica]